MPSAAREGPFDVDLVHDAAEVVAAMKLSDLVDVVLDGHDPVADLDPYGGDEESLVRLDPGAATRVSNACGWWA